MNFELRMDHRSPERVSLVVYVPELFYTVANSHRLEIGKRSMFGKIADIVGAVVM